MSVPAPTKATRGWLRLEALRLEAWAMIAASAMVLAVVVGTLPRVWW